MDLSASKFGELLGKLELTFKLKTLQHIHRFGFLSLAFLNIMLFMLHHLTILMEVILHIKSTMELSDKFLQPKKSSRSLKL